MGELAQFGHDEPVDEPDAIVWRDSAGNGLTQEECDDLAYKFRYYHAEQELTRTENYWKFLRWCVENGRLVEGEPDGTASMRPHRVMKPLPHVEYRLEIDSPVGLPSPDDDLPPAA